LLAGTPTKAKSMIRFIIILTFFLSCNYSRHFSKEELRLFEPFSKPDTIIFKSDIGQFDTIIFSRVITDTIRFRNIEQGFYDNDILRVGYKITEGSYHKFLINSVTNEPEYFISFSKTKRSYSNKEICFLGLLFNESYLNQITANKESQIVFEESEAQKTGVNINQGIKSFVFDFGKGVVYFIDKNNIKWSRLN
jgi:hypothetical protein